jgi:hypothetical protein
MITIDFYLSQVLILLVGDDDSSPNDLDDLDLECDEPATTEALEK